MRIHLFFAITLLIIACNTFSAGLDLESSIEYQPIDISGKFLEQESAPKKLTAADRLRVLRSRLEKRNEILVKKQIERMRYLSELRLMKKLQKSMDRYMHDIKQL